MTYNDEDDTASYGDPGWVTGGPEEWKMIGIVFSVFLLFILFFLFLCSIR